MITREIQYLSYFFFYNKHTFNVKMAVWMASSNSRSLLYLENKTKVIVKHSVRRQPTPQLLHSWCIVHQPYKQIHCAAI